MLVFLVWLGAACGDGDPSAEPAAFELRDVVADGASVGCSTAVDGLGPDGLSVLGVSDLRFYVSNLQFWDADGEPVELSLDENDFQYQGESGQVSLIDLTGSSEGTCAATAIAFAEGTARTNSRIRGMTLVDQVRRVTFDVGVPQALMKEVIAANTVEGAPSPLAEMYWTWASGYRHFVLNAALDTGDSRGDAYIHVGSRDCGPAEGLALEDRDRCGFINTPQVALDVAQLSDARIAVDVAAIVDGLDFVAPVYDPETFEPIGEDLGVECHSSPMQPDCEAIFSRFGLTMSTGEASPSSNVVFISM